MTRLTSFTGQRQIPLPLAGHARLDAVYAILPRIECRRLCQECCGPVFMERIEWDRIVARLGYEPKASAAQMVAMANPHDAESLALLTCPILVDGGCSAYDVRPAICRLWGLVDSPLMRCPHGCQPERWMTDAEAHAVLAEVERISVTSVGITDAFSGG